VIFARKSRRRERWRAEPFPEHWQRIVERRVPVFARLYDACMEAGLPIGCAPNIHVSLVMLPEECKALSGKRYVWKELKLAALKRGLGWYLNRRFARADAAI